MWWLSEVTAGEEESFSAIWKKAEGDASASEVNLERHQVSAGCSSRSYVRQTVTGGGRLHRLQHAVTSSPCDSN